MPSQGFFLLTLQTDFSKPLGCHVLIHTQLKTGRDLLQISRAPSLCCCLLSCLLSCPVLSSALASLDCPFYLPNSGSLLSFLKVFVHASKQQLSPGHPWPRGTQTNELLSSESSIRTLGGNPLVKFKTRSAVVAEQTRLQGKVCFLLSSGAAERLLPYRDLCRMVVQQLGGQGSPTPPPAQHWLAEGL